MVHTLKEKHAARDTYGPYRLVNRVAVSQSCELWEAEDSRDQQPCAVKIISAGLRGNRQEIGHLKHEYSIGRQLQHESVIRMEAFGNVRGMAYLAMEYFPAPNLKQWQHDAGSQPHELIQIVLEKAARSLQYMHSEGFIHRDVKPDNYLVDDTGNVKLIDFTLARRIRGWLARALDRGWKRQGTLSYMSPEQIRNKAQDHKTDMYSFGCVAYELICGKPPYSAPNANELLHKHLQAPIPQVVLKDGKLAGSFESLLTRMLAKDPVDRPESMSEVLRHIRAVGIFEK